MADRFPSLEDFDTGAQTDIKETSDSPTADDFLAREKALLGDDAAQFASVEDDDDLLGGSSDPAPVGGDSTFESQFPDIQNHTEALQATGPSVSYNSGYQAYADDNEEEQEPEVIKEWREKRDAQIAKRAQQHQEQKAETVAEAQRNIDDFYDNYNNKKEKNIAQSRKEAEAFLANREDTTSGGTSWERIAKLVNVTGKGPEGGAAGSGKERFRELLLSLRKDEKAPGAEGY